MKILSMLLSFALGAGLLLSGGVSVARADAGGDRAPGSASMGESPAVATQPGTDAEARDYAAKEARSPEVQEYSGGAVYVGGLVVLVILVILIVILLREV